MNKIDHLVYTSPTLEEGMDCMEQLLGVRPIVGGKHHNWGTHNALLSLGDTYLEVVAPCPELTIPEKGIWLESFFNKPPQVSTWALQTDSILTTKSKAAQNGIKLGETQSGERQKPDGSWLNWHLTDPYELPQNGTLPFLIDWQNSTHPSHSAPKAGELVSFTIKHPNPALLKAKLDILEIQLPVVYDSRFGFEVEIETEKGTIVLN